MKKLILMILISILLFAGTVGADSLNRVGGDWFYDPYFNRYVKLGCDGKEINCPEPEPAKAESQSEKCEWFHVRMFTDKAPLDPWLKKILPGWELYKINIQDFSQGHWRLYLRKQFCPKAESKKKDLEEPRSRCWDIDRTDDGEWEVWLRRRVCE